MKTYDEIKRIITEQLGITDQASYRRYAKQFVEGRVVTQEEIDLLSPDLIDNRDFWRAATELFKTDPVSNCLYTEPVSIAEANRRNMTMYHLDGFTGLVEWAKIAWHRQLGILEIGPGYGAFKEWILDNTRFVYHAADVNPLIEEVDQNDPTGMLSNKTLMRNPFSLVVSSNTFQHLSLNQRRTYYSDIHNLLVNGGAFMVSMMMDDGSNKGWRDVDGHAYCRHYGQFTQIQTRREILEDLDKHFRIMTVATRDRWITVTCMKIPPKPVETAAESPTPVAST